MPDNNFSPQHPCTFSTTAEGIDACYCGNPSSINNSEYVYLIIRFIAKNPISSLNPFI